MKKLAQNKGFTLIEILVVIGIIAILATIVLVAVNPAKRFQDARNSQRQANIESILNAIQQNMVDNKGVLTGCPALPTIATDMKTGGYDIASCITNYLAVLPVDPQGGTWSALSYDTNYYIRSIGSNGQIEISAPNAVADGVPAGISLTR